MTTRILIPVFVVFACLWLPAGDVLAASGGFNPATLSAVYGKSMTLKGSAEGVETVRIEVENEKGRTVYKSSTIKVRNEEWKARISKKLPKGIYELTLTGKNGRKQTKLATETLIVDTKTRSRKDGTLTASMLPLLMGGNATAAASIPVAYVKLYNGGNASTTIKGFTLKENGSAPDFIVTGFATSDDKGGSRTTSVNHYKDGEVFVPLYATFAPGQIRIFTVKATLAALSYGSYGKEFKMDVTSVESDDATIHGVFPLRGTTWRLAY